MKIRFAFWDSSKNNKPAYVRALHTAYAIGGPIVQEDGILSITRSFDAQSVGVIDGTMKIYTGDFSKCPRFEPEANSIFFEFRA